MAIVIGSSLLSGDAERLAREAGGPHWSVFWPSCERERPGPSTDPGEPVALFESAVEAGAPDKDDALLFDVPFWDRPAGDELSKPGSSGWVDLIVEVHGDFKTFQTVVLLTPHWPAIAANFRPSLLSFRIMSFV